MADLTDRWNAADEQEQHSKAFTTAGERWRQAALLSIQQKIPKQRRLQFAADVQARHGEVRAKFAAIANRVRAEKMRSPAPPERSFLPDEAEALIAAAESPVSELPPEVERSSHFMLDARLKNFLAGLLNIRIPAVKIYTSQAANTLTRKYGADALTYRNKILFRAGKYNPRDAAGIALLGHELTHAAQAKMERQTIPIRVTNDVLESQEQQALVNEARVLQHLSSPASLSPSFNFRNNPHSSQHSLPNLVQSSESAISRPPGNEQGGRQLTQGRVGLPQAALSSRQVNLPPEADTSLNSPPYLSEEQLNQIKEEVYMDLMDRIRREEEIGA